MALITMEHGRGSFDVPTPHEIAEAVSQADREHYRGIKYLRLPLITGTASNSKLDIGGAQGNVGFSPDQGDCWMVRLIWVNGLTTGLTPDVVNVNLNGQTWWQLNGNNFAYTFGKGELVLQPGETFEIVSVGTFASTSQISFGGSAIRCPAEMLGKLLT